jgi:hypothetical protein
MNVVEAALRQIAADLDRLGATWALVGGFAVSVRSEPRFTRDVDVAVAVSDDEVAEHTIRALLSAGYRLAATIEQETTGRLATAWLLPPFAAGSEVVVDLLFASSGIEPEIAAAADRLDILPELTVPVATVGHLLVTKLLARNDDTRPQDAADLRALGRPPSRTRSGVDGRRPCHRARLRPRAGSGRRATRRHRWLRWEARDGQIGAGSGLGDESPRATAAAGYCGHCFVDRPALSMDCRTTVVVVVARGLLVIRFD